MRHRIHAIAAAVAGTAALVGSGPASAPSVLPPPPAVAPEAVPRVGAAGVTLALMSGWSAAPVGTTAVSDPVQRVAVSSTPARLAPNPGSCTTEASERTFSPSGALVLVMEYTTDVGVPIADMPVRPVRFDRRVSPELGARVPTGGFECFDGSGWTFSFGDGGRRLLAWILLGPQAPPELEADALTTLGTLTVTPW